MLITCSICGAGTARLGKRINSGLMKVNAHQYRHVDPRVCVAVRAYLAPKPSWRTRLRAWLRRIFR